MEDFKLSENINFLGASGVKQINGLMVGYLSGIDSDIFLEEGTDEYTGNYFHQKHIAKMEQDFKACG